MLTGTFVMGRPEMGMASLCFGEYSSRTANTKDAGEGARATKT